jgi:hypothetical protein
MCEKCRRQTTIGTCTHPKSRHFLKPCPGVEQGADIRECDFAEVMPCKDKCQKCDERKDEDGIAVTTRIVRAPFTDDQIASLNAYQKSPNAHPYTCGNDHKTLGLGDNDSDNILKADRFGWHCQKCSYLQDWARKDETDWSWKTKEQQSQQDVKKDYLDVSYKGKHAKMTSIWFGNITLELDNGEKITVHESQLDSDWRTRK